MAAKINHEQNISARKPVLRKSIACHGIQQQYKNSIYRGDKQGTEQIIPNRKLLQKIMIILDQISSQPERIIEMEYLGIRMSRRQKCPEIGKQSADHAHKQNRVRYCRRQPALLHAASSFPALS